MRRTFLLPLLVFFFAKSSQGHQAARPDAVPENSVQIARSNSSFDDRDSTKATVEVPQVKDSPNAEGNISELQELLHGSDLHELRTTYNGSYGASILYYSSRVFYGREPSYYVALFHDDVFWRVIKTSDQKRASAVFKAFVAQTESLSKTEFQRLQLESQKSQIERQIAFARDRAKRLNSDIEIAREQQAKANDYREAVQSATRKISQEREDARRELAKIEKINRDLENELNGDLPEK